MDTQTSDGGSKVLDPLVEGQLSVPNFEKTGGEGVRRGGTSKHTQV